MRRRAEDQRGQPFGDAGRTGQPSGSAPIRDVYMDVGLFENIFFIDAESLETREPPHYE
jgi:hypothetical protein